MVKADAARKPLQELGEFIKGTAFQASLNKIPVLGSFSIDPFKLMLDVKQPYTYRCGQLDAFADIWILVLVHSSALGVLNSIASAHSFIHGNSTSGPAASGSQKTDIGIRKKRE